MTIAQDPATAQHDGMPRSAIESGTVDYVLPVPKIVEVIPRYLRHSSFQERPEEAASPETSPDQLNAVISILRTRAKFDFSYYKKGTLGRRVRRRMGVRHVDPLSEYVQLLRSDPDEVNALYKDLLINVTSFFREPKAWEALNDEVIAKLIDRREAGQPIRAWVPACASGEEAYTLGMLFLARCRQLQKACPIQLFASDVDLQELEFAREGVYPESIAADVPPEHLRQFFHKGEHTYQISKELRESIVFAHQNLLVDPPFSKLDLICCRNLLIYLEADVQKKALSLMHFALAEGGYLFLGSAESIGGQEDLFETVSKKLRIYRRIGPTRHEQVHFPAAPFRERDRASHQTPGRPAGSPGRMIATAQQLLLDRYAPACVIINRRYEILHFSGPTHDYLVQPPGPPTQNLLAKAREGVQTKLRGATHRAILENRAISVEGVRIKRGKTSHRIRFIVEPIKSPADAEGLLLISFEDEPGPASSRRIEASPEAKDETVVEQLESELRATREDLQSTVEELETSNEELRASSEEVMSVNEELQSTNEEIETSKEELQSLNEELNTVNSQLEGKVAELEDANNDLNNLLVNAELAVLFLDTDYRIRRFTPPMTRFLRLIPTDIGRLLTDFESPSAQGGLLSDAEKVMAELIPQTSELKTEDGRWWLRRTLPYRTDDRRIDGVVITLVDITDRKEIHEKLQRFAEDLEQRVIQRTAELEATNARLNAASERLRAIFHHAGDAILTITDDGLIESFNPAAERTFGHAENEIIGRSVEVLMPIARGGETSETLMDFLKSGYAKSRGELRDVIARRKDGSTFPMDLTVTEVKDRTRHLFITIARDLTSRRHAEEERRQLQQELIEAGAAEQRRIGQELHDHLGQMLSGTAMLAGSLKNKLEAADSAEAPRAAQLTQHIQDAYSEVRKLSRGLVPVVVDEDGLMQALEELCSSIRELYGIACIFHCPRPVLIPNNDVATRLYRIAQEAVTNAARHGKAQEVEIVLKESGGQLALEVRDNGVGMPERALAGNGMGLRIMRYRTELMSGKLQISPIEPQGTLVRCVLKRDTSSHGAVDEKKFGPKHKGKDSNR